MPPAVKFFWGAGGSILFYFNTHALSYPISSRVRCWWVISNLFLLNHPRASSKIKGSRLYYRIAWAVVFWRSYRRWGSADRGLVRWQVATTRSQWSQWTWTEQVRP